jgi:hypothetical protein
MKLPSPFDYLRELYPSLARMVTQTSWLPHPGTVAAMGGAVFPTARARRKNPRFDHIFDNGRKIGMYDDNTTPTWAIRWTHEIVGSRKGWAVAHVWSVCDDIKSYTHLANLVIVPECFASLTDKVGPLTGFLRWHAWVEYGWKPEKEEPPSQPQGYEGLTWQYLEEIDSPKQFVHRRLTELDNDRTRILRPLMPEKL